MPTTAPANGSADITASSPKSSRSGSPASNATPWMCRSVARGSAEPSGKVADLGSAAAGGDFCQPVFDGPYLLRAEAADPVPPQLLEDRRAEVQHFLAS